MKLSGTINGRRVKVYANKYKQPGERSPDFRVYDVTDAVQGEKIDWKACEIGALWADDGPRKARDDDDLGSDGWGNRPYSPDDDDLGF